MTERALKWNSWRGLQSHAPALTPYMVAMSKTVVNSISMAVGSE